MTRWGDPADGDHIGHAVEHAIPHQPDDPAALVHGGKATGPDAQTFGRLNRLQLGTDEPASVGNGERRAHAVLLFLPTFCALDVKRLELMTSNGMSGKSKASIFKSISANFCEYYNMRCLLCDDFVSGSAQSICWDWKTNVVT
jgi:hypothetical protein